MSKNWKISIAYAAIIASIEPVPLRFVRGVEIHRLNKANKLPAKEKTTEENSLLELTSEKNVETDKEPDEEKSKTTARIINKTQSKLPEEEEKTTEKILKKRKLPKEGKASEQAVQIEAKVDEQANKITTLLQTPLITKGGTQTSPGTVDESDIAPILELGKGGDGAAHVVQQKSSGGLFALKVGNIFDPETEFLKRARQEMAQIPANEDSISEQFGWQFLLGKKFAQLAAPPQIVRKPGYLTEVAVGGTLDGFRDWARKRKDVQRVPTALIRLWAAELVLALGSMHRSKYTHNDAHTGNIFLDFAREGGKVPLSVKLGDFGSTKFHEDGVFEKIASPMSSMIFPDQEIYGIFQNIAIFEVQMGMSLSSEILPEHDPLLDLLGNSTEHVGLLDLLGNSTEHQREQTAPVREINKSSIHRLLQDEFFEKAFDESAFEGDRVLDAEKVKKGLQKLEDTVSIGERELVQAYLNHRLQELAEALREEERRKK